MFDIRIGGTARLPRVCYLLSTEEGDRCAGLAFQQALGLAGVPLVNHPAEADAVIIHDAPFRIPDHVAMYPDLAHRYIIIMSDWQATTLPEDRARHLEMADEIWTCSKFCQAIFSQIHPRVMLVPHILPRPEDAGFPARHLLQEKLALDDDTFVFYAFSNGEDADGITDTIAAFSALEGEAHLVIRSEAPLGQALPARVTSLPGPLASDLLATLHERAQCLVSAHRGAGWNMALAGALSRGNAVVATGFGGCLEVLSPRNARLVDHDLAPVPAHVRRRMGFGTADPVPLWAVPRPASLHAQMAEALRERHLITDRQTRAVCDSRRYSAARIGETMARRLVTIGMASGLGPETV
ncbi:hypothetical protein [Pseudooceanicola aestuarii]|uniref:hypothetical protein n=1 Tax=Pseudooceanicola aestuarii TaxID=2697319 RepID=UPI0013D16970|nr:hypothetical protein [Pseudooceanicola aestuarii]